MLDGLRSLSRPIRPAAFSLIAVAVGLALYAVPFPPLGTAKRVLLVHSTKAAVAIVGPSTISAVSACDHDRRAVPAMLSDLAGRPVLDLSVGGQPLSDSLNLAAVSGRSPSITDVVLPIAYPYSDDWTTPAYSKLFLYKALVPRFPVFDAASLGDLWAGLTAQPERVERGYRFEGKAYPDYRALAADEFAREKSLATCPEAVTHDPGFTRSYLWWAYVAVGENPGLYDLVAALDRELGRTGRRLHVVLLPNNLDLLGQFDPAWPGAVRNGAAHLVSELERRRVHVVDLSAGFAGDEFSTQWCGCIHLNQAGRLHLAQAVAAAVLRPWSEPRPPGDDRAERVPGAQQATQ